MEEFFISLRNILAYNPAEPMLFNTGLFLVLFTAFLLLYHAVKGHRKLKALIVIAFSLYFYYKSSADCVFILAGVCLSDYLLGLWLDRTGRRWLRRLIVGINVAVNLGMLVYFKYINLIGSALASIAGSSFDPLDVILPAGISFFTFRSISYMVDIYRGQLKACRNFLDYAFFLTFFPPLLAGPVVRAKDMLPQIASGGQPSREMTSEGLFLIMTGLIKKVVVADYISSNFVDRIFDNPLLYSGFENSMGCIGFTIQLYCDFSGYSDMAIGLALLLGYRFKDNFMAPFKSQSPSEFWSRWHISLSTWLRDYLYIPLGGNRRGKARMHMNLIATMALGGLWHGASWMYVIWGLYNGFLLVAHKILHRIWRLPESLKGTAVVKVANIAITFTLMVVGFTIFRAPSMQTVSEIATQIFTNFHLSVAPQFIEGYAMIVLAMFLGLAAHMAPRRWTLSASGAYVTMPVYWQAALLAAALFFVVQARQSEIVPFIYLQY
jgi:D-alanyl-lipoteichoic acid acyltransferase DltB (MBOAT superfamily)